MKLQFCGAARTVTGSCYYMEAGGLKFVVDCGAFQGNDKLTALNHDKFPFNPAELDYVFLTHAHFDHSGRLPVLTKQGFKGKIISTAASKDLAELILLDSAHLQKKQWERWEKRSKRKAEENIAVEQEKTTSEKEKDELHKPLYNEDEVNETVLKFQTYEFGQSVSLTDRLEFRMRNSGHILGSASFEFWIKGESGNTVKIVFSGDLGQPGSRIIKDPDMIREADYVIVESTYGNRLHRSKDETLIEFLAILKEAQKDKGNILIPTFAVERAQELLYEMNLFVENRLLTHLPVYLDSPMAIRATRIFQKYPELYDEDARRLLEKGDDPFNFPGLHFTESVDDSKRLVAKKGVAILAGSGMVTGGRIIHHLANNISSKKTHILFVGYQVKGTLGRRIVDGEPDVRIKGKKYEVHAQTHTLGGFSAHADERDLRYWLRGFGHSPKTIFVTHGEESISLGFAHNIQEELDVETKVPQLFETVELS